MRCNIRISHRHERGAALMVSMVLIFVLSILGITSMRSANVESQLAANAVMKDLTFQAAESASDQVLTTPNALEAMVCQPKSKEAVSELQLVDKQATVAEIEYGGLAIVPGNSLGGQISARRFFVSGTSELINADTSSTIRQGVVIIGAGVSGGDC